MRNFYSSPKFLASYETRLGILADIADGLQALHLSNVIHGDVKPDNILIFPDKDRGIRAKICDFGYAIIDPGAGPELQQPPPGTGMYNAPEVAWQKLIVRDGLQYTDVYSFGIVIWQTLLGGTMPFSTLCCPGRPPLTPKEIVYLKTGLNQEVADLYGISVAQDDFLRLNRADQSQPGAEDQEPAEDTVNDLLFAMAWDTLKPLMNINPANGGSLAIPRPEMSVLLSALRIALSSRPFDRSLAAIRVLLGQPNTRELISFPSYAGKPKCPKLS
jgi:serine/threonine protein kinase